MSHQEMLVSRPGDQQMTANVSACGVNANVLAQVRPLGADSRVV
jgi:hypothetical protein